MAMEAPVLRPSMEEFADFECYMHSIHELGTQCFPRVAFLALAAI